MFSDARVDNYDVNRYQKSIIDLLILLNAFKICISHHCTLRVLLMERRMKNPTVGSKATHARSASYYIVTIPGTFIHRWRHLFTNRGIYSHPKPYV